MSPDSTRAAGAHPDPADGSASDGDWAARLTQLLGSAVEVVRDKSVRPAALVAAGVVVALGVLATTAAALALVAVGAARGFDVVFGYHMWATYCLFGGIFTVGGVLVIAMGNRATRSEA